MKILNIILNFLSIAFLAYMVFSMFVDFGLNVFDNQLYEDVLTDSFRYVFKESLTSLLIFLIFNLFLFLIKFYIIKKSFIHSLKFVIFNIIILIGGFMINLAGEYQNCV